MTEFAADEARFVSYAASVPGTSRRRILAAVRKQLASLPAKEYPTIVALAGPMTEDDQDALFQAGIDLCLHGIDALITRRRR